MNLGQSIFIPGLSTRPFTVVSAHEGGFGRVYVIESSEKTKYAIKTLKWEQGHNRDQLRQEALKLADIPRHEHVIDIIGIEWIDGDPFIILPYCGHTLADIIGRLDTNTVRKRALEIAVGLSFLHDRVGLLHLDLKPQNVLLDINGKCLLCDFGLSKCYPVPSPSGACNDIFISGLTGTISYMSPEHFVSGKLSAKSDVFAMGIILYEMVTGKHPFLRSNMDTTVRAILIEEPEFIGFHENLDLLYICKKCLNKNPSHRPSASDVAYMLNNQFQVNLEKNLTFDLPGTINRATTYLQARNPKRAEDLLLSCLQHYPSSLLARINLAEVYLMSDRFTEAMALAEEALELAPWCPDQNSHLATLFTNMSYMCLALDPSESLKYAHHAISLSENDWQAFANAAEACRLMAEGETPEREVMIVQGIKYIEKAMTINPGDVISQITYGNLLLLKKDFSALQPIVIKCINTAGGDNLPARVLLIRTFIAFGQLDDAEKWIQPMTKHEPLRGICDQLRKELNHRQQELYGKDS